MLNIEKENLRRCKRLKPPTDAKTPTKSNQDMAQGVVKWFNDVKGFGFITPDEGGEELFAHFSAIEMKGFKSLKEGQKVTFEVVEGPKGKQATHIKPVEECQQKRNKNKAVAGVRTLAILCLIVYYCASDFHRAFSFPVFHWTDGDKRQKENQQEIPGKRH